MCGIVGMIGDSEVAEMLLSSIGRPEYRGYDSCGIATVNSAGIETRKDIGSVEDVARRQSLALAHGSLGIAHTRWATHGGVTRENAHPHLSCDKNYAVVHNGIISNHRELRNELQHRGHRFSSQTDTEVFAHLIEETHQPGVTLEEAFTQALRCLEGTFAIVMISAHDPRQVFCAREKSPLVLGIAPQANFVGSDINAFLPYTRRVVLLDDGEYALVSRDGFCVRDIGSGTVQSRQIVEVDWTAESDGKAGHQTYMEKEILEQPEVVLRAMEVPQKDIASLGRLVSQSRRTILTGVGSTYYVALFGQYLLATLAAHAAEAVSSDEARDLLLADQETLLLAVSQSGETFDTLQALRQVEAAGGRTAAIVNVPGSSMTREAKLVIHQNSGPEVCVVSTKAVMAQMVLLVRLALEVTYLSGRRAGREELPVLRELVCLADLMENVLKTQREKIRDLAKRFYESRSWFFLGRGIYTAVALESALKMKEVTYLHAEGMPAGFLKHGTLSLIDQETPSVFLVPPKENKELYDLTLSSAEEVRARQGPTIGLAFDDVGEYFDEVVRLPEASPRVAPFLHVLAGQLLAYETAVVLKRNIDRPRALAKSVTVS